MSDESEDLLNNLRKALAAATALVGETDLTREVIGKILQENITFSGQLDGFVVHGAIEKILAIHQIQMGHAVVQIREANDKVVALEDSLKALIPIAKEGVRYARKYSMGHQQFIIEDQEEIDIAEKLISNENKKNH
jgi:hypothetical protein